MKLEAVPIRPSPTVVPLDQRSRRMRTALMSAAFFVLALVLFVPGAMTLAPTGLASAGTVGGAATEDGPESTRVRLLPISVDERGRAQVETVVLEKDVRRVVFYLDGDKVAERKRVPFQTRIEVPPEGRAEVRVVAYGPDGRLGEDTAIAQRGGRPLRVRIAEVVPGDGGIRSGFRVVVDASSPMVEFVDRLELSLDGERVVSQAGSEALGRTTHAIDAVGAGAGILTATLHLADGRWLDDAVSLDGIISPLVREEVDVRLVQLQAVATDKRGTTVVDIEPGDLQVFENGTRVDLESAFRAPSVALTLGLAVDTSGSMRDKWRETIAAVDGFLGRLMSPRDQAFLVDFDVNLELRTPPSSDPAAIRSALEGVQPDGGTALYDSIVFSLLQFQREPGRRGLVVITDGVDAGSFTNPERTVELARRFGVPVYLIVLEASGRGRGAAAPVHSLKLLTEPSGGRIFRVSSGRALQAALQQIRVELEHQILLSYSTTTEFDWRKPPKIEVRAQGRPDVRVKTVFAADY